MNTRTVDSHAETAVSGAPPRCRTTTRVFGVLLMLLLLSILLGLSLGSVSVAPATVATVPIEVRRKSRREGLSQSGHSMRGWDMIAPVR